MYFIKDAGFRSGNSFTISDEYILSFKTPVKTQNTENLISLKSYVCSLRQLINIDLEMDSNINLKLKELLALVLMLKTNQSIVFNAEHVSTCLTNIINRGYMYTLG